MEIEDSYKSYKENCFEKWQKAILSMCIIVSFIVLGIEIFTYSALLDTEERFSLNMHYISFRIIIPSLVNFGSILLFSILKKQKTIALEKKNLFVSFAFFIICSVISIFHNYFQILLLTPCVAIYVCTIFGSRTILKALIHAIIPTYIISAITFITDAYTGTLLYKILTLICEIAFIICSYYFAQAIVKTQKNQLSYIKDSYKKQSELIEEMRIDPLTRLYNRTAFSETLLRIINIFKSTSIEPYIVMMDIDFFKRVNDKYGHIYGDEVLVSLSEIIRKNISFRKAFRFGGEEFILLFEDSTLEEVIDVVERIRKDFASTKFEFDTSEVFTISAGISGYLNSFDKNAWIESADKAMYYAKEHGRDQIKVAELIEQ